MESNIFLGLGSNVGNRLNYFGLALDKILNSEKCTLKKYSSVYETRPYGNLEQGNFLNGVIQVETNLTPDQLFDFIKSVEIDVGRRGTNKKWAPREIDIDILFYNQLIYNEEYLIIPHPEVLKRDFVLIPMIEIAPDFLHPLLKKKLSELDYNVLESFIIKKTNYQLI